MTACISARIVAHGDTTFRTARERFFFTSPAWPCNDVVPEDADVTGRARMSLH